MLADGTIRAAERGRSGECCILGNREVRFRDFARMIAEEAGTKPLMTSFSVYNLARNNCFDSTNAMRELGYRTRSYQETMHDEIQWLIKTGKVKKPAVREKALKAAPVHA